MKMKIAMILLIMAGLFSCRKGDERVPSNVMKAFTQKFPGAQNVKADMEDAKEWEFEFTLNGENYSANFDLEGNWKETEYQTTLDKLPAAVSSTLDEDFEDMKIEVAEVSETAEGKVYEFALEQGENKIEVAIDANGKVVSQSKASSEEDESGSGDKEDDED